MDGITQRTRQIWLKHWQEEVNAAFLYRQLAELEPAGGRRDLLERLAKAETRHAERWERVMQEQGIPVPAPQPGTRVRLYRFLARRLGLRWLMPLLAREEAAEVESYLSLSSQSNIEAARETARALANESAEHMELLNRLSGDVGHEPWHHAASGDLLRNVVYGFNDGLTANFGLVAGVIGGSVNQSVVLLSGLAGMIADALSMGASGYLASKSEQEVYTHEIELERREIELMPRRETEELTRRYRDKGLSPDLARQVAEQLMRNPDKALADEVRDELNISAEGGSPLSDGVITGLATAVGALIPVLPFLFLSGRTAAVWSFAVAMASHFGVGAARSFFTGRGVFRSGLDMFLVGFGVAVISYLFGDVLVKWLMG